MPRRAKPTCLESFPNNKYCSHSFGLDSYLKLPYYHKEVSYSNICNYIQL